MNDPYEDYCDDEQPSDDDAFIQDLPRGGYSVSVNEQFVAETADRDIAEQLIRDACGGRFFPNVWLVSDHGNAHLIEDFDWQAQE